MKRSYLGALLVFALVTCAIAWLSFPGEITWIAMYLDNHKLKRAEELLWKRYQRDPADLETAAKLADTLTALEKYDRAKEIVQDALRRNPESTQWKRRLALIWLAWNDPLAAASALPPLERDREFWLALARVAHEQSLDDLAEEALFARHEEDEDKAEVWRTLALWCSERGDTPGERTALEKAMSLAPEDEALIVRYFRNRVKAGDEATALQEAEKLPKPLEREYLEGLYEVHRVNKNYRAARLVLEELCAREDALPADYLALVSILYLQNDLADAWALLERLAPRMDDFSPETKMAFLEQKQAVRGAMLLEAARKGNEEPALGEIAELAAATSPPAPEVIRNLLYACLTLSDFFSQIAGKDGDKPDIRESAAEPSAFWLAQAKKIFEDNKASLPLDVPDNAYLAADLAERNGDWAAMLDAWSAVVRGDGPNLRAMLGMARASRHLRDYAASWRSLLKAEALVKDEADWRVLATQALAVARALPSGYPGRAGMLAHARGLARKSLAREWDNALALDLFFQGLEAGNLDEAQDLLLALERRGLATPDEYLGLAEAQVAKVARHSGNGKDAAQGADRGAAIRTQASRNARKALKGGVPEMLPRLLYVFMALNDKPEVSSILKRMEGLGLYEKPESLLLMADAYGFAGNQQRQFELLEKRARVGGKLADWLLAFDRRYGSGDHQGALLVLESAESIFPENAELTARRIQALVDRERHGDAVKAFQNARKKEAGISEKLPAQSLAALALAYDKTGRPERSRQFYKLSLAKDPDNYSAVSGFANLCIREGKPREAAGILKEFLEVHPGNIWAQAELARLRPVGGKRLYNDIIASVPASSGAREKEVLAKALWGKGRLKEAAKVYSEVARSAKRTPAIMCDYAQVLLDAGDNDKAKKVLLGAVREFPDDLRARHLLAKSFIRLGEYSSAGTSLRKALAISPGNPEVLRDLAYVQQIRKKGWAAQRALLGAGKR